MKTGVLHQPASQTVRSWLPFPPSPSSLSFLHRTKKKNDMATHPSKEFGNKGFFREEEKQFPLYDATLLIDEGRVKISLIQISNSRKSRSTSQDPLSTKSVGYQPPLHTISVVMVQGLEKTPVTNSMPILSIDTPAVIQPRNLQMKSQRFTLMDHILPISNF